MLLPLMLSRSLLLAAAVASDRAALSGVSPRGREQAEAQRGFASISFSFRLQCKRMPPPTIVSVLKVQPDTPTDGLRLVKQTFGSTAMIDFGAMILPGQHVSAFSFDPEPDQLERHRDLRPRFACRWDRRSGVFHVVVLKKR
jgi:hypothetical protein